MSHWHEKLIAKVGLRMVGVALLAFAWTLGRLLQHLVMENAGSEASAPQMLLAGLIFISASAAMALTIVGAGLWKTVKVSERWATRVPIPVSRDLEPSLFAMSASWGDHANQQSREAPYDGERSPVRHSNLSSARRR